MWAGVGWGRCQGCCSGLLTGSHSQRASFHYLSKPPWAHMKRKVLEPTLQEDCGGGRREVKEMLSLEGAQGIS